MSSEHAVAEKDTSSTHVPEETPSQAGPVLESAPLLVSRSPRASVTSQAAGVLAQRSSASQATLMRQIQRTRGNRYAQRVLAQLKATAQRQCDCGGLCDSCKAQTSAGAVPASAHLVQTRLHAQQSVAETGGPASTTPAADVIRPPDTSGNGLDAETRRDMESHFGRDLGGVRLHSGAPAARAAEAIQADAYTVGSDIYFGEGKYSPGTAEGRHLLAHELTHVVQQESGQAPSEAAASHDGTVLIGSPHDPLEKEAESSAASYGEKERAENESGPPASTTADSSGAVRRREWTWSDNPLTNTVGAGAKYVGAGIKKGIQKGKEFVVAQIEKVAPGAIAFFRGIRDYFKNAIGKGVGGLFGGLLSSIREKGIAATLSDLIGHFASDAVHAAGGFIAGNCAAFGKLMEYLGGIAAKIGGAALEGLKKNLSEVAGTIEGVWAEYGAPALEFVKNKLKAVWKEVETNAGKIWESLKPLREAASDVWDAVTDYLAEGRKTVNAWLDWFIPKALEAWQELKEKIKPYMEKIKAVAKVIGVIVLLLSPIGPFVVIAGVVYGVYLAAKALKDGIQHLWDKHLRELWVKKVLPTIQESIQALKKKIDSAKLAIINALYQVHDAILDALTAFGAMPLLNSVSQALQSFSKKFSAFKDALGKKIEEWSAKIHAVAAAAEPYIEMIKEALRQTLLVTMFGPLAILDDGVWGTLNAIVRVVMKTPCLRELGGLLQVPDLLKRMDGIRQNIKAGWKLMHNPGPFMEALKKSIQPMIDLIEPGIKKSALAFSFDNSERELVIHASIIAYLADSLVELGANWWTQLKKLGHDLLWPWDEVGKDFMPMIDEFGKALSKLFNLEFSEGIDHLLEGMRKFNGIVGALSGWFMLAMVLLGAAFGAFGFVLGPVGGATVGAGASAGLAFAEQVGMALLAMMLATEAAVIAKAYFDLQFQNIRIANVEERNNADQEACKKIAGSVISVITVGALMLLGDMAARFGKWLASFVDRIPLLRDVAAVLKTAKKKVADFSFVEGKGGAKPSDASTGASAADVAGDRPGGGDSEGKTKDAADPVLDDAASKAEQKGVPKEQFEAEVRSLREKASNPENVRRPADKRFDAEMDAEGHTYDRESESNWCRHSAEEVCGLQVGSDVNAKVDNALKEKGEAPKTEPDVAAKDDPSEKTDAPLEDQDEGQPDYDDKQRARGAEKRARGAASKKGIELRKKMAYDRLSKHQYDPLQELLTRDEMDAFMESGGKELPRDIDWHHTRQSSADPGMADVPEHIQPLRHREHIFGEHGGDPGSVPTAGIRADVTSPEHPIFDPNDPEVQTRRFNQNEPEGDGGLDDQGMSEADVPKRKPPDFRDVGKVRDPALQSTYDLQIPTPKGTKPAGVYRREIATGNWVFFPK